MYRVFGDVKGFGGDAVGSLFYVSGDWEPGSRFFTGGDPPESCLYQVSKQELFDRLVGVERPVSLFAYNRVELVDDNFERINGFEVWRYDDDY